MKFKTDIIKWMCVAFLLCGFYLSCVEEIELKSDGYFESALVVEAILTDELKTHKILLSRSYEISSVSPILEFGAKVSLVDENGVVIYFQEVQPGMYLSEIEFQAMPNIDYELVIILNNGDTIKSEKMQLTHQTQIDELYVQRGFNENNVEGISVFVNSYDEQGSSKYYRFEYEETYKIVAPLYTPLELVPNDVQFPILNGELDFSDLEAIIEMLVVQKFRDEQEQICYNTINSNDIIQVNTNVFDEDRLDQFRIRFIGRNNYYIAHRYSILVRQYVQSLEGYTYYNLLNEFSQNENIFSESQTGQIEGNLFTMNEPSKFVIGFFEVSSVDEKRVYFNYSDLFPQAQAPEYYTTCDDFFRPPLLEEDFAHNITNSPLLDYLNSGMQLFDEVEDFNPSPFENAPFRLVIEPCGDCTYLGKNYPPIWWEE